MLVDDHVVVLEGLTILIQDESDLTVVGAVESPQEALRLIPQVKPHVILVDIALGEQNGLDLIKKIHDDWPDIAILALSMHDENLYAERAMRAGAKGYIMKKEAMKKVLVAIRQVLAGEIYVSDKAAMRMAQKFIDKRRAVPGSVVELLSDREFEVFNLIAQTVGPTEIATRLAVSVKTIETHRERIKQKLNLKSGPALTRFALQWSMKQT
jgi:DNA-binding NarL/FixJ family response regulator